MVRWGSCSGPWNYMSKPCPSHGRRETEKMEQAIAVLIETGLSQNAAGQTRDEMQHYLDTMRQNISLGEMVDGHSTIFSKQIEQVVTNTVAVMTSMQEHCSEWRETIEQAF